jgi:hypothetical protein
MFEGRRRDCASYFVFAGERNKPPLPSSLAHLHAQVRRRLKLPKVFVLYSLRHTALTRPGETGADAYTRLLGEGTASPRYWSTFLILQQEDVLWE